MGRQWTMMKNISVTEYLNYKGGKFSKSRGTVTVKFTLTSLNNNKIINPCKPYLSASATAPHPLGRRKAD
jgi:hypothetical protein